MKVKAVKQGAAEQFKSASPHTVPAEPEKQQPHRRTRRTWNTTPRAPTRHARSPDGFPALHLQLTLPFFLPYDAYGHCSRHTVVTKRQDTQALGLNPPLTSRVTVSESRHLCAPEVNHLENGADDTRLLHQCLAISKNIKVKARKCFQGELYSLIQLVELKAKEVAKF